MPAMAVLVAVLRVGPFEMLARLWQAVVEPEPCQRRAAPPGSAGIGGEVGYMVEHRGRRWREAHARCAART